MCPPPDDYDRDSRPSWKEIDKRKDRSSHRADESKKGTSPKERAWIKKAALKEAKGLFDKKLSMEAKQLIDQIQKAGGADDFPILVNRYIDKFGMPGDWRHLMDFLDHPQPEPFSIILKTMAQNYKSQSMLDRRAFKTKLSILSNTAKNGKIQRLAKKTKDSL